jgi:DNA polymerase-1
MLLQVHDELVFEAPEQEVEATIAVAKRVMQGAAQLSVPLTVEAGSGDNWEAAH